MLQHFGQDDRVIVRIGRALHEVEWIEPDPGDMLARDLQCAFRNVRTLKCSGESLSAFSDQTPVSTAEVEHPLMGD